MSTTLTPRSRFPLTAVLAALSTVLFGGIAAAQSPRSNYIPPDVKGFGAMQMRQQAIQQPSRTVQPSQPLIARSSTATPSQVPPVWVSITFPNVPDTAFVAIRGPDGELRYFPVEGGKEGLRTRVIVVHPGERVHVQLPSPNPR